MAPPANVPIFNYFPVNAMARISTFIAAALAATTVVSCGMIDCIKGSGEVTSQSRSVAPFHSIESNGSMDVIVTQGPAQSVRVEAEDNIIPFITTEVSNGVLSIGTREHACFNTRKKITVYATMPDVKALTLNGSGDLKGASKLSSSDLAIEMNGSGDVELDIESQALKLSIDGSGDAKLTGHAAKQTIMIDGAGDVDAEKLQAEETSIEVNGSGDCKVSASQALSIDIAGSGDVYYRGTPTRVTTNVDGSGSVHKMQ